MRAFFSCLAIVACVSAPVAFAAESGADTESVRYAQSHGWTTGFADGTFRPDRTVTKAELVKIVVQASGHGDEAERCRVRSTARLKDVPANAWFSKFVCAGIRLDLIKPPSDGLFQPAKKVTLAEVAKMLAVGLNDYNEKEMNPWYKGYVENIAGNGAVPIEIPSYKSYVTRGQLAEMLWRLQEKKTGFPSSTSDSLLTAACTDFREQDISGVDLEEVKRVWLGWYNDVRSGLDAQSLRYDKQLTKTAFDWSAQAARAGSLSHKRPGQTSYYDYNMMVDWFAGKGLTFKNVERITFTENIGWGMFKCPNNTDCTQTFIAAVRTTFDMYMAEKGKASASHYNSIVNPNFKKLGLGIAISGNKYYLTAHYATEITSDPAPLCP